MSHFVELFPRTRWDADTSVEALAAQALNVAEETGELAKALRKETPERALEEACDVMVSASSLVRRLAELTGTTPEEALALVTAKNAVRGYHAE